MTTINVTNTTVSLQDTTILDSLTTTFSSGKFAGLIGPNGAGKTTLLRAINGRLTPTEGSITIGTDPITSLTARELGQRIATVPQNTNLSFDFTVRQIVEMGRHPHHSRLSYQESAPELIDWALARTEITHLENRPITDISGGERQRVLIARALAQDTPILLLDEPTANLDINHQIRTLELIKSLVTTEQKTVIAAIHDLDLAARYCDTLHLLDNATIIAKGPPDTVLTPHNIETAFDTNVSILPHPVTGTPTVTAKPHTRNEKDLHVHVIGGGGSATFLLYELRRKGFTVTTGIHHETDPEHTAADQLDIESITIPHYTPIRPDDRANAEPLVDTADVTVLANLPIGPTNLENLRLAESASNLLLVTDTPFETRNAAGEQAANIFNRLTEHHPRVTTHTVPTYLNNFPDQLPSLPINE